MSQSVGLGKPGQKHGLPESSFTLGHTGSSGQISPVIQQFIDLRQTLIGQAGSKQPMVEVNEAVGMWAFAYEKLRNSVEYREETVLLRAAIKRILKRRLSPLWNYESTASALVRELIWARYLKNDAVPQSKVEEIEKLLAKYSVLRQAMVGNKEAEEWEDWILGIAACDIEQVLLSRQASYALAEVMLLWLKDNMVVKGMPAGDVELQLYLAVHRTLLKSDRSLLNYHLFLINVAGWHQADEKKALEVAKQLASIRKRLDEQLNYEHGQALARAVKKQTPPFIVLDDIVSANLEMATANVGDADTLDKKVETVCQSRYRQIGQRIRTAIFRSIIYIFITKVGLALLLEVPFDNYFYGEIHWPQLAFNIAFPPLFMAILGLSIKTPSDKNTEVIGQKLLRIVQGLPDKEVINLDNGSSRASAWSWIFFVISAATFIGVSLLLWQFDFTIMGIGLFLFFFCVVVFFTYRVRQIAREMSVIREKENFIESWITIITLPFLALGYRLSTEFGKINVTTFILDVLLEAPFKFILDMAESWVSFVRTKRDEVIDRHDY